MILLIWLGLYHIKVEAAIPPYRCDKAALGLVAAYMEICTHTGYLSDECFDVAVKAYCRQVGISDLKCQSK